jgi:hypothetical protein
MRLGKRETAGEGEERVLCVDGQKRYLTWRITRLTQVRKRYGVCVVVCVCVGPDQGSRNMRGVSG